VPLTPRPRWPLNPRISRSSIRSHDQNKGRHKIAQTEIYIYKWNCLYFCSSFTCKPPDQSPPNFAQNSPPTQERFLTQLWPKGTPNYKTLTGDGRKTLCNVKCSDGYPWKISVPGSAGPQLASCKVSINSSNREWMSQHKISVFQLLIVFLSTNILKVLTGEDMGATS